MASKKNEGRPNVPDDDDDLPPPPRTGMVAKLAQRGEQKVNAAKKGLQLRAELDELLRAEKDREAILAGKGKTGDDVGYKLYQTLYPYKSDDADDLNFEAGEILRVFDDEGNWFEGENQQGKRGSFPATYVRKMNMPSGAGGLKVGGLPSE